MERLHSGDDQARLSHRGKIISFHLLRESTTPDTAKMELKFCSYSFDPACKTFCTSGEGAAVISSSKISAHVDIVSCRCAGDVQHRDRTPCVLMTKKKGKSFNYRLLTLIGSNQLQTRIEFKLPYQIKDKVCILGGPTVLWSHENSVFYTSLQTKGVRKIPGQISHCIFGELPLHRGQIFVLGLQNISKQSPNKPTSSTFGCFIGDEEMFDGGLILPHPYISITQCILVLGADRGEDVLKCTLIAATSNQQLVYFENGMVKDVCQLPFEQAKEIQMVNTGRNGSLFVILFHQGNVCAVWKETLQIACQWSGVSSVHVEDFLGCGTEQMLLVFEDQGVAGEPLGKFLITDLCGVSYSGDQDSETSKTAPPAPENYLLMLQALESRLQNGLIVLQELQGELRVKDRVLQQSIQVLGDVVSGRETVLSQHEQEALVALWDCDDESNDGTLDDEMQDAPAAAPRPQVDKLWHRVTEDRLVVGVMLTADVAAPVSGVSLSLLTATGRGSTPAVIQTRSQVWQLAAPGPSTPPPSSSSSSSSSSAPAAKRSKRHSASDDLNTCGLAVTAVTELAPLLNSGSAKCRVMLRYVQKADAPSPVSGPTPAVLHCGEVAVDIHNVFQTRMLKPQHEPDELREDLLSLLAVLDRWVFLIDSPDYSLGDMDAWMQRAGCKKIDVLPRYLLLESAGPSALTLLRWEHDSPFQGELSVHCSQLQMLRFLDSLTAFLPASCFIRPVRGSSGRSADPAFPLALEREVSSLRECVSALLCEGSEEEEESGRDAGREDHPEPGSADGLRSRRELWRQDVERSRRRLSPLVDVQRYRELVHNTSQTQINCDLAALLDAQRTFLT
ncbi:Fanconi anemia group B protein [Cololabis saira]|uniref:Fanconi anemia group B protein n=1 Tax=Cololabis saira TaxID=129043 RepID=UPI002AD3EFC8|nr:Fanconi anemia group B protein [Cololabis saira]